MPQVLTSNASAQFHDSRLGVVCWFRARAGSELVKAEVNYCFHFFHVSHSCIRGFLGGGVGASVRMFDNGVLFHTY